MTTERSIWTESNDGSSVTLFSCAICGASVQRQDKETHEKWHHNMTMMPRSANWHSTR